MRNGIMRHENVKRNRVSMLLTLFTWALSSVYFYDDLVNFFLFFFKSILKKCALLLIL